MHDLALIGVSALLAYTPPTVVIFWLLRALQRERAESRHDLHLLWQERGVPYAAGPPADPEVTPPTPGVPLGFPPGWIPIDELGLPSLGRLIADEEGFEQMVIKDE